jgi:hypothetical protein
MWDSIYSKFELLNRIKNIYVISHVGPFFSASGVLKWLRRFFKEINDQSQILLNSSSPFDLITALDNPKTWKQEAVTSNAR